MVDIALRGYANHDRIGLTLEGWRYSLMQISDVYQACEGDYDDVIKRLLSDERIAKYLKKFADGIDFDMMAKAIEQKNWEDAFRYAHNLKGISLNLAFTKLAESTGALCDIFRGDGEPSSDYEAVYERVKRDRKQVLDAISTMEF